MALSAQKQIGIEVLQPVTGPTPPSQASSPTRALPCQDPNHANATRNRLLSQNGYEEEEEEEEESFFFFASPLPQHRTSSLVPGAEKQPSP